MSWKQQQGYGQGGQQGINSGYGSTGGYGASYQGQYGGAQGPTAPGGSYGGGGGYSAPYQPQGQPTNTYQPHGQPGLSGCPPGIDPTVFYWFQSVDQDRSGKISAEELRKALMNDKMKPFNRETCRLMIGMFDRDGDGTIDLTEFGALWDYIQKWRQCFDSFDRDRSGNIDQNELHHALNTFGYRLSMNFCQLVVSTFDKSSSRSIDFDYFIQVCVMLHTLTDKFRAKDTNQNGSIQINYEEFLEMVLDSSLNVI